MSYENNIEEGTAKVIITGIDTYTGKVERTFNIKATQQPEPEEPEEPENPEEPEKPNDNIIDNTNTTMNNTNQNNANINTSNENLYNENTSKNNISNSKVNNSKDKTIAPTKLPKAGLSCGIIAMLILVLVISIIFYKRYTYFKGIK